MLGVFEKELYSGFRFQHANYDPSILGTAECRSFVLSSEENLYRRLRRGGVDAAVRLFAPRLLVGRAVEGHLYKWSYEVPSKAAPHEVRFYCTMRGGETLVAAGSLYCTACCASK